MNKKTTYASFMDTVETSVSNLSQKELQNIILYLAEKQPAHSRDDFLDLIRQACQHVSKNDPPAIPPKTTPEELISRIKEFEERIRSGEFYDEDRNYRELERSLYYDRRARYYDEYDEVEDTDFSDEECVIEAIEFLNTAEEFFLNGDYQTALTAYTLLFNIFNDTSLYEEEECFIYGFSFESAIDSQVWEEHETIYFRCRYLDCAKKNDFSEFYSALCSNQNIFLSDIIGISRSTLPKLDQFTKGFIEFLTPHPQYGQHLVDVLTVRGGMKELKQFAYSNSDKHPCVFLSYYNGTKDSISSKTELAALLLDGIRMIPEKYRVRSYIGLDLADIALEKDDQKNRLSGLSTAFYSDPTLRNFTRFTDFILSKDRKREIKKLRTYLNTKKLPKQDDDRFWYYTQKNDRDIFSLDTAEINPTTLIIARYLLDGIDPLVAHIDPKKYLGFSHNLKHIAASIALTLKTITGTAVAHAVDALVGYYCLESNSDEYPVLKKLIAERAAGLSPHGKTVEACLSKIETLTLNRVNHVLTRKARGGYDSACLMLVACAEAKQHITKDGDGLISRTDKAYKRFSAFRAPLKRLTSQSRLLAPVE